MFSAAYLSTCTPWTPEYGARARPVSSTVGMGAMPRSISASRALGTIQGPPMVASALPSRKRVFTVEYSVSPGMRATNFRW